MVAGPAVQVPWPSQTRTFLTAAPSQVPVPQLAPGTRLRQAPLPSQVPSRPQLDGSDAGQVLASRGTAPAGTKAQTPGELGVLQDLHVPVQALLQQNTQIAEMPGDSVTRVRPASNGSTLRSAQCAQWRRASRWPATTLRRMRMTSGARSSSSQIVSDRPSDRPRPTWRRRPRGPWRLRDVRSPSSRRSTSRCGSARRRRPPGSRAPQGACRAATR